MGMKSFLSALVRSGLQPSANLDPKVGKNRTTEYTPHSPYATCGHYHGRAIQEVIMEKPTLSFARSALVSLAAFTICSCIYMKALPAPDVDKTFLPGNNSCWLATAANMLARNLGPRHANSMQWLTTAPEV
jgi:hypothetical protein